MRKMLAATVMALFGIGGCAGPSVFPAAGSSAQPTTGAAAWAAADEMIAPAADAVAAIDLARRFTTLNLQNANTPGYRALRCETAADSATVIIDVQQGPLKKTGRDMDIAINGRGFFCVELTPGNYVYTRNGHLFVNAAGDLALGGVDGCRVMPPIHVPNNTTQVEIEPTGKIYVFVAGQVVKQEIGMITLNVPTDATRLKWLKDGLYERNDACDPVLDARPGSDGGGLLEQGYLEQSNVNIAREQKRIEFLDKWRAAAMR